ncbi:MAG: GHKL domain-containing protein [Fimbriimonadaceae bacterium]|nr:GHKL domain-containing protein [Fimbriimonadaceae bacterium]QYK59425.1 MAG: GHKL domain-containing protein [Fimbriimonadaceae bacterium]
MRLADQIWGQTAGASPYALGLVFAALLVPDPIGRWLAGGLVALSLVGVARLLVEKSRADEEVRLVTTRSRVLEVELVRQKDALDDFAEGLDTFVFLIDGEGTVLYANRLATAHFDARDSQGSTLLAVTLSSDLQDLMRKAVALGAPVISEIVYSHPIEMVGQTQVWPESAEEPRYFVSIHNITDLRRLERVRRDFVANVSHELRTPMTTVRAMAETLIDEETEQGGSAHRYLSRIVSEVDRLTRITDDLLILSQAESTEPAKQLVDLSQLVELHAETFKPSADAKSLRLLTDIEPGIQAVCNEAQINQVLTNLIDNAINYTQSGHVTVRLATIEEGALIEVEDTGVGISSENTARIFERFYRVDRGRSRQTGGTGLGLSIVRHIVEAHGGKVSVESQLNQGSCFRVVLPCRLNEAESTEPAR